MSSPKRREAIQGTVAFSRGKFESNRTQQSGLNLKTTRTDPACGLTRASRNGYLCAMMLKPSCMRRCECGSSLKHRRIAAAPCVLHVHGVSFRTAGSNSRFGVFYCAIRVHGFIASIDFMGAPCGELLSSPFPVLRSFHTRTVPPACGRADGFDNSNTGNSAMTHHDAASVHAHAHTIGASSLRSFLSILSCGNIRLPRRMTGCRLGGLLKRRRITAAPRLYARGFSFGAIPCTGSNAPARGIRYPGRIALNDFMMSAPGGKPSGLPLPTLRSANLPGVALLLAEERGKDNSNVGNPGMNLHVTEGASSRALNLGASSLRSFLSILSCGNIRLPARMSGCGFSRPLNIRRISAAPRFYARGFSFGPIPFTGEGAPACVIRYPGRIAPTDFVMGTPGGKPSGLPFPDVRSANPPGVARPLAGVCGSNNSTSGNSAMTHHDAASVHAHAHTIGASSLRSFLSILSCGNIRLPARMSGRRLGGLLKQRRMTAAPCFSKARGVSFKVSTFPGVDAPSSVIRHPGRIAPSEFVMGAPGGELSSSPLPLLRSANLPGVAHLLAEVSGFSNPNRGNSAMNKHEAVNAPARALNLGLCKVLNLINCFTGKAGYVQPLGSYPATGPGMRLPSIWKVNPELLELARVEANRAAASMEVRHA